MIQYEKEAQAILRYYKIPVTDENIGITIYYLHKADIDYNGIGTIFGYRKLVILHNVVGALSRKKKRKRKINTESIDVVESQLPYIRQNDFEKTIFWDNIKNLLTNQEYETIYNIYINGMTLEEIAKTRNCSKQYIQFQKTKILEKLRRKINVL